MPAPRFHRHGRCGLFNGFFPGDGEVQAAVRTCEIPGIRPGLLAEPNDGGSLALGCGSHPKTKREHLVCNGGSQLDPAVFPTKLGRVRLPCNCWREHSHEDAALPGHDVPAIKHIGPPTDESLGHGQGRRGRLSESLVGIAEEQSENTPRQNDPMARHELQRVRESWSRQE
jgi:hypothetical protein